MPAGEMIRSAEGGLPTKLLQRVGELDGLGRRTVQVFVLDE